MVRLDPAVTSRLESLQESYLFRCEGYDRRPLWLVYTVRCDLASSLKRPLRSFCPWPHHLAEPQWALQSSELPRRARKGESPPTSSTNDFKANGLQFLHLHKFVLRLEPAQLIFIGHGQDSQSGGRSCRCHLPQSGSAQWNAATDSKRCRGDGLAG